MSAAPYLTQAEVNVGDFCFVLFFFFFVGGVLFLSCLLSLVMLAICLGSNPARLWR